MKKTKPLLHYSSSIHSILAMLLFTFFISGTQAQNYTWTTMPPLSSTLFGPASFSIGSNIYVISGWAVSEYAVGGYPVPMSHAVWQFNTNSNTWTQKNDFPGTAVYSASSFTIGNYGYIVNGWDSSGSGEGPSTTWQYDPSSDTWTQKADFPGSTRYTAANFVLNGKAYIACGFKPYTNDVWCFDPVANSWTQKSNFPGSSRQAMVYFAIGNTAYAGMGATGDGMGSYFIESDWYKYNDATDTWTLLNPFPGDAIESAMTFVINGEAYVTTGLDQSSVYYANSTAASNKVWKYTPTSDTWTLWGIFPDSVFFAGASGQANGAGYGGFGAHNFSTLPITNTFYRFGPATGAYSCSVTVNQYEISNAVYNFQANGNFSPTAQITWNFGDGHSGSGTSVIHNYTTIGNYTVTAYVADSACSDSSTTSVSVSNINNCSVAINETSFGTLFTLSTSVTAGAGPYSYQWSCTSDSTFTSNSPDPVLTVPVNTPTTYCVTVTDISGCVASACRTVADSQTFYTPCQIYLVVYPDSAVPGYYYGVIYTASNTPLTYIWDFGDGTTSNQLFPSHTYATPGYYTICLTVSDGAGCSFTFCDSSFYAFKYGGGPMVHFDVRNSWGLGITNVSSANGISLYPNPTTGEISINTSGQKIDNATISDINGQTVLNTKSPTQNKMDVSQLSDGIYFIEVKVNGISTRLKFVKAN